MSQKPLSKDDIIELIDDPDHGELIRHAIRLGLQKWVGKVRAESRTLMELQVGSVYPAENIIGAAEKTAKKVWPEA